MPGMRLDAVLRGERGHVGDALELDRLRFAGKVGVAAGVELDHRRGQTDGGLDLLRRRLDEQADADAGFRQPLDERAQLVILAGGVEPAFCGSFLAFLGDDAGGVRLVAEGDGQHLLGRRHLEIERHRQFGR